MYSSMHLVTAAFTHRMNSSMGLLLAKVELSEEATSPSNKPIETGRVQSGASYLSQGFEDIVLGSSPG